MLHRIFGLHGFGKTEYVYNELAKCVEMGKNAFLIVPEQQALLAERTLIDRLGNPANMYIEVINFKRLCNRVFRESGGVAAKTPDKTSKLLAMSHVLYELRDMLTEYGKMSQDADFAEKLLKTAEELKMCRVSPESLEKAADYIKKQGNDVLSNKIKDVAAVCEGYDAYMENTLDFPGDLLDKLVETLSGYDFFEGKTVFVDSFYGFTAQEFAVIEKIIKSSDDTYITFLCKDEKHDDRCFKRATEAAKNIRKLCEKNGVEYADTVFSADLKHAADSSLNFLSNNFSLNALSMPKTAESKPNDVEIIRCTDIYSEVNFAVKTVSDLLTEGAKPREIAVCARNTADYAGIIEEAFENAEIPFSFDNKETLSVSPTAALVISAFEIYFSWNLQSVISFIKTGVCGLCDDAADELELYMRTWRISGKKYFHEDWYMNPDGLSEMMPDKEKLCRINEAKSVVENVLDSFCENLDKSETAKDVADAVYNLTKDIAKEGGTDTFSDNAEGKDADLLYTLLDNFVSTVGNENISPKRFYDLFKMAVKNTTVGKMPERIDEVRFSDVSLMRTDGVKYVVVLGLNDGVFPAYSENADVFKDSERKLLKTAGVELSGFDEDKAYDEIFLAYTAICSAKNKTFVTYRKRDMSENEMYPSVIVKILSKMLDAKGESRIADFDDSNIENYFLSDKTLFDSFTTLADGTEKETVKSYFENIPEYEKKIAARDRADFTPENLDSENIKKMYENGITGSYSRLEKFKLCPFSYFCRYTLKLTPDVKAELGAIETGNFVHKALEEIIPEISKEYAEKGEVTDEYIRDKVKNTLENMLKILLPYGGSASAKRFEYMFSRFGDSVFSLCKTLAEELCDSKFIPSDFELDISEKSDVKPIKMTLENGKTLSIIGKIDRVDLFTDKRTGKTWVRVIDYKTGTKKFELDDVHKGFNLQMLLYLYTLIKNTNGEKYKNLYPAGVLYKIVERPSDKTTLENAPDIDETDVTGGSVNGLVVDDFDVVMAMDVTGTGKYVPAKLAKDSDGLDGSIMDINSLSALLEDAAQKAAELANEMSLGTKKAEPYKDKNHDACKYCDVKTMCPVGKP